MDGRSVDYVGTPRNPGVFEQTVDGFPTLIPVLSIPKTGNQKQLNLIPNSVPNTIRHEQGKLTTQHVGWFPIQKDMHEGEIDGNREATYQVVGRSLFVQESLVIENAPRGSIVSLVASRTRNRPIRLDADLGDSGLSVDVDGMSDWRSRWSEITEVTQFEFALENSKELRFSWSITPGLVVASSDAEHPYNRSLYSAMQDVHVLPVGLESECFMGQLREADLLHLSWPERWTGIDLALTKRIISELRSAGTRIVWTQHNLIPHKDQSEAARNIYELWASVTDAVIHHSEYGKKKALSSYRYPKARHYVIPHGHWGQRFPEPRPTRAEVEAEEGWQTCDIRLAVIGQPRPGKDVQSVLDAFFNVDRDDMQLVARVSRGTTVPPHPRVCATTGHIDEARYYRRLSAVDGLILPFAESSMLATGTAFDCIGGGIAPVSSSWKFLRETFGNSALYYGESRADLENFLSSLSIKDLISAGIRSRNLQKAHDWKEIGSKTLRVMINAVQDY